MKTYQSRKELDEDVKFLKSIIQDEVYLSNKINILFKQWMETSPDSPWYDEEVEVEQLEAAETLVKINRSGVSNQWKGDHTVFNEVNHPKGRSKYYNLRHL
jgi:hypothetical protein